MKDQNSRKESLNSYAKYSSIAFQMLFIILAGVYAGIKLDAWLKIKFPIFTLVLSLGAVSLSIYYAIKDFLKNK